MNQIIKIKKKMASHLVQPILDSRQIPFEYITLDIIEGCISKCETCYQWKKKIVELNIETYNRIVRLFKPFLSKKNPVVATIGGGGEPMMNKDLYKILETSVKNGFVTTMITNSMLVTRKTAKKIISTGLYFINMSLESNIPEVNDKMRGIKGHHRKVMNAIEFFSDANIQTNSDCYLGINITVCELNLYTLIDTVKELDKIKAISSIRLQAVTQVFGTAPVEKWYQNQKYSHLWPKDMNKLNQIYDELINMKKNGFKIENSVSFLMSQQEYFINPEGFNKQQIRRCDVYRGVTVNPYGDIVMCPMDPNSNKYLGPNTIFSFFDIINPNLVQKNIVEFQNKVKNCSAINCHTLLNCNYTGDEQFNDVY